MALLVLALLTLAAALVLAAQLILGLRSIDRLADAPELGDDALSVSVVVAARDEARDIGAAITSLLAQDYPALEVVAVDDRSSDGTGSILDRLARDRDDLEVIHLSELPEGWLGKNHALHRGAERAHGELLLFTDADVIMEPSAIRRAVALLEARDLGHLAVAPRLHAGGPWATMTVTVFLALFSTVFRPWRASDPDSRHFIGVGAFNLVRAEAYRAIGGHASVALRPDDDVRLGRALKTAGFRQAAAAGREAMSVEWYPSLGAMERGLRKNAFAVVEYRLSLVAAGTLLPVTLIFWPVATLFLTTGAVWWANLGVVAVGAGTTAAVAKGHGLPIWTGLTYPLASVFLLWIVWSATLRAVVTGTVEWRGRKYRLDELRRG